MLHMIVFVAVFTNRKLPLFGEVANGALQLNTCGKVVEAEWLRTLQAHGFAQEEFAVLPTHAHGLVSFADSVDGQKLDNFIIDFRAASTYCVNTLRGTPGDLVWGTGTYCKLLDTQHELDSLRRYIAQAVK